MTAAADEIRPAAGLGAPVTGAPPPADERRLRVAAARRRREWMLIVVMGSIAIAVAVGVFFALR